MMDMDAVGTRPKAIINVMAHPVWAALAIELNIPLVDRLDKNPVEAIATGDWVKVDAEKGIVEITRK
jgi:predicted aconitase with swiveling domain